jgi:hypothetical protein
MAKAPSRDLDKFIVRLPPGMRDKIAAAASRANRTMNSEIVSRLEFTFDVEDVQNGGFDFRHGVGSPELGASFVKHQLGDGIVNAPGDDNLKARVAALETQIEGLIPDFTLRDRLKELEAQITILLTRK